MGRNTYKKWVVFLQNYPYNEKITPVFLLRNLMQFQNRMESENISQDDIRMQADYVLRKTNIFIRLCDSVLPEEEGRKRLNMRFREREKARRKATVWSMIRKFFRYK